MTVNIMQRRRNYRSVETKFILGELKQVASEARRVGVRALAPRKSFTTTPFRSLANPIFGTLQLKEKKDDEWWESFQEKIECY